MSVEFFAAGEPVPQGSMSAFAVPGTKHISIVASNKRSLDFWRGIIHAAAADVVYAMYKGPIAVEATLEALGADGPGPRQVRARCSTP